MADRGWIGMVAAALALLGGMGEPGAAAAADPVEGLAVERRIVERPPDVLGTTRLGGSPDLPATVAWPRCARRPMAFLGQVRAEELPPGSGLPSAGLLSFFTQVAEDPFVPGTWLWAGDCSAVLVLAPGRVLRRRAAPLQRPRLVLRHASVRLRPGTARPGHRLLGPPVFSALDPRDQCAVARGGAPADWRLVLQLDHDPGLRFAAGDAGRLFVLARAGRLDQVCSVFDAA